MKKGILISALLLCIAPSVFGQQKTAYQTRKIAIENKYLQQLGVPLSDITQLRKKGSIFIDILFAEKLKLYGKIKGSSQQMALISRITDELRAAEKLKTAAEIKAEKDKNQQYKNEEEAKRIQKENLVKEKAKDIPHIKNDIKEKFSEWAKKGEFESNKEHFERIQSERAKKLHKVITDCLAERLDYNRAYHYGIKIELDTYNADEEIYPVTINKIYRYDSENFKFSVKNNIPFEREEAIEFKKIINTQYGWRPSISFLEEDPDNWFVKDGFLFPINMKDGNRLIKISDKGNYPLFSEYVFNTNDLGLSEYFPENYTFTLKKVRQEEELKKAAELKAAELKAAKLKAAELKAAKEEAERIRKEEEQREKDKNIPRIKDYIKKEFLEWAEKGEFESNKEHFKRIQSERVKKLRQLTAYTFEKIEKPRIYIDLGTYNADEKIYPITIELSFFNDYKISVKENIPFKIEEAIGFKNDIYYNFLEEDPNNWFVKDGFLFPINVEYDLGYFIGGKKFKKIFDKGDNPLFSEYVFNTDDLGLSEYFPENYTFTLKSLEKSRKK